MSSKSPLLSLPPERPPLINWHVVSVAASAGIVLIAGAFAWIATHPAHKDRGLPVALVSHPAAEEDLFPALAHPLVQPLVQTASLPLSVSHPVPAPPVEPPPLMPAPHTPATPAPLPAEPAAPPPPAPVVHPPTETYGTQVNFLGIPEEAVEQARREKKLLFVLHVSGNFEESCFT